LEGAILTHKIKRGEVTISQVQVRDAKAVSGDITYDHELAAE
jgi:hypothetical protein